MARINETVNRGRPTPQPTHEGGDGYRASPLTELAFTCACSFLEDSFYETAKTRTARIVGLVQDLVPKDPNGVVDLIRTLRHDFKVRTVSIVVAAEYAHAAHKHAATAGRPAIRIREAVANACWRADEPAEFLAYWLGKWGRSMPRAVKLGLSDAIHALYTQKAALKWDSKERAVRMGDVIEMAHPRPESPEQATLYRYLLDLRHRGRDAWEIDSTAEGQGRPVQPGQYGWSPSTLQVFMNRRVIMEIPEAGRREALRTWGLDFLAGSGMTWEALSSYLPGGMDAEAWRFAIPHMGVNALCKNLANFDKAGIGDEWVDRVIAKITNEGDVVASRIYPYQVLLAYQYAPSDNWKRALNKTLNLASANAPSLPRSLVLVDVSQSMTQPLSAKSKANRITVAALQAVTVVRNSPSSDLGLFATHHGQIENWHHQSVLSVAERIQAMSGMGELGSGTNGHAAIASLFNPARHDRVIIFTDDQMRDSGSVDISMVPTILTFNCEGYSAHSTWGGRPAASGWHNNGKQTNITVAGFSDEVFRAMARLMG